MTSLAFLIPFLLTVPDANGCFSFPNPLAPQSETITVCQPQPDCPPGYEKPTGIMWAGFRATCLPVKRLVSHDHGETYAPPMGDPGDGWCMYAGRLYPCPAPDTPPPKKPKKKVR